MGRDIFSLMLIGARNQKTVEAKLGHLRAQLCNARGSIGRICGDVEILKSHFVTRSKQEYAAVHAAR